MIPMLLKAAPGVDLKYLFQLSRLFRNEETSLTLRIEQLMIELRSLNFSSLKNCNLEDLNRARYFAEEIIVLYVSYFYDVSLIPVTFYKREKWIRRHLDQQFSLLFKEISRRSEMPHFSTLITEEPIYYLLQKVREKSFPRAPKSKNRRPHVPTLKIRFHVELARRLDSAGTQRGDVRVLLPYQI